MYVFLNKGNEKIFFGRNSYDVKWNHDRCNRRNKNYYLIDTKSIISCA